MATEIKSTSIKSQNIIAEPQVNKPGSPEQGQIIQATGTGDIAKGIYQYSGASWVSLDNAQGDLETLRLIMSTDTDAVGFSSALNSTSTLAGNTNAVPHETSTGTGMLGALEIPSTGGDALLTEFDANKVFRYYSAGANNNNDYFGIPVDIPAQTRGQNIVIKFKYRTEEASAASSNGDFQVSVWDKSNGVSTTQASTLTTGTTITAGSNILMTAKTNLAVGDRIWFETGTAAVNNVANGFTEAYITSISSTDNNITVSEDVTVVASGIAVTGWLSSKTEGLLPEADSDTNKVGKDYSIAVKTEEDTEQVVVWFSNKSTTTNVIELFFDGILVSQNKFLQVSSQAKSEYYQANDQANFWDASGTTAYTFDASLLTAKGNSPPIGDSKYLTVADQTSGTNTVTSIKAKQNITLNVQVESEMTAGYVLGLYNSSDTRIAGQQQSNAGYMTSLAFQLHLQKDDYIYFVTHAATREGNLFLTATPEVSDVVILESQDEIFTGWQAYTPTITGATSTGVDFQWRRVGSNMEIRGKYMMGTRSGTDRTTFTLPSGYNIDTGVAGLGDLSQFGIWSYVDNGFYFTSDSRSGYGIYNGTDSDKIYYASIAGTDTEWLTRVGTSEFGDDNRNMVLMMSVPIQGWNANFNPVLSMPLVEIGGTTEQALYYAAVSTNSTSNTYRPYYTNESYNTVSGLGVVDNSSSLGWNFKATQKVKATVNWSWSQTSTGTYSASLIKKNTLGTNVNDGSTDWNGYKIARMNTIAASNPSELTASVLMEPGDYLFPVTNVTNSDSASDRSVLSLVVEKDFSNTNMAHIIKPAVALIQDVKASNTASGVATQGSWLPRILNTIKGESWFVTLSGTGTTGVGGTNTDFTLEAGTYEMTFTAPFYKCENIQLRLYDVTNSAATDYGQVQYARSANYDSITTNLKTVKTITASTEFRLQYQVGSTSTVNGLGAGEQAWGGVMVFAQVLIRKLK